MPLKCSEASKLAGFKSAMQVSTLANISKASMYIDFNSRFSPRSKPRFIATLRKAMDKKHMIERAVMEAAIKEIMKESKE